MLVEINQMSAKLSHASNDLAEGAAHTNQATEQIAATIEEVSAGSDKQAQSMHAVSQTLGQMSSAVQQIAVNSQQVSQSSQQAADLAESGNTAIHTAASQMVSINHTVNHLSSTVKRARAPVTGNRSDPFRKLLPKLRKCQQPCSRCLQVRKKCFTRLNNTRLLRK